MYCAVFIRCTTAVTRSHSLPFVVTCCHSLNHWMSLFVTRCTTHCHSFSLVVIRCHSLYYSLSLVATRCHSLLLVVPLVVIRCDSLYHSLSFVVNRCTTCLSFYKRFIVCEFSITSFCHQLVKFCNLYLKKHII